VQLIVLVVLVATTVVRRKTMMIAILSNQATEINNHGSNDTNMWWRNVGCFPTALEWMSYLLFRVQSAPTMSMATGMEAIHPVLARTPTAIAAAAAAAMTSQAAKRVVGEALAAQLSSYGSRKQNAVLDGLASVFDLAGVINDSPTSIGVDADAFSTASELERVLVTIEGSHDVCRYLCRVASGMADRPSRPGREVPFRPFSSRDAHVMLQIKRTAEVSKGARVRALFDASLQAGKAARDPSMVPELVPLKPYGTDGRYSSDAPEYLIQAAVEVC